MLERERIVQASEEPELYVSLHAVESEFDGIAEEVITQFLQSEPTWPVDLETAEGTWRSARGHEQFINGCGNNLSGRPMVDSGAFTSCCPEDYAREVPIEESPKLNLKSVLGEKIQHYGVRKNL